MNQLLRHVTLITLIFLTLYFISCDPKTEKTRKETNNIDTVQNKKTDYELANQFLLKLRKEKVDTIIFSQRTCISCCDFFNIFWTSQDKKFLTKFYFDFADMKVHSVSTELLKDKVFTELSENYSILKTTTIKENEHKLKNGYTTLSYGGVHYCYTQVSIFTSTDSILTDRIKDHSFEKYTAVDQKDKGQTNDNYLENRNSEWNSFLKTIEEELKRMTETKTRELQALRTQKAVD